MFGVSVMTLARARPYTLRKNTPKLSFRSRPAGEESRPECFQGNARLLVVPQGGTPRNDRPEEFFRSL
jgi:hypothetical protein